MPYHCEPWILILHADFDYEIFVSVLLQSKLRDNSDVTQNYVYNSVDILQYTHTQ